jgi:hypothetical protein
MKTEVSINGITNSIGGYEALGLGRLFTEYADMCRQEEIVRIYIEHEEEAVYMALKSGVTLVAYLGFPVEYQIVDPTGKTLCFENYSIASGRLYGFALEEWNKTRKYKMVANPIV